MIYKELVKQIEAITSSLIENSFQIAYNWVSIKNGVIRWENFKDISFSLKKIPYVDLYKECCVENAFHLMLNDGALLQFMYECDKNAILRHRLAFYPNPNGMRFQDEPENFESIHYGNELFAEVYEKRAIVFPVRFDFDVNEKKYLELDHSFCHLTLGNYQDCRIPVSKPITPNKFMLFILRSFYFNKFKKHYDNSAFQCTLDFNSLLTENEKRNIHVSL